MATSDAKYVLARAHLSEGGVIVFIQRAMPSLKSSYKWVLEKAMQPKTVARRHARYLLALLNRQLHKNVVVVGITGSAGKTTTKDLCVAILAGDERVHGSKRSMNEHDGVVETIRGIKTKHQVCVVELSASSPGYLDHSLKVSRPDIAVLTVVAREHFSAFKSIDAIAQEKAKLVAALPGNGTAVLNMDDPQVRQIGESCDRRVIWVGEREGATLRLRDVRSRWPEPLTLVVEHSGIVYQVPTQLHGAHLAQAVLCALGAALALGIPLDVAIPRLVRAEPTEGRMQIVRSSHGVIFVRDDWKAPLWSLHASFEFMNQAEATRKILIIGTLSDYSLSASKQYPKVARQALEIGDIVVFVGPHATRALKAANEPLLQQKLFAFPSLREASAYLHSTLQPGDFVLLKGSHKADHLVRLILDHEKPIGCWKEKCREVMFCQRCEQLHAGVPPQGNELSRAEYGDPVSVPAPLILAGDAFYRGSVVVVGLGNPGAKYSNTPHNVGYRVLDQLADRLACTWESVPEGQVCSISADGRRLVLFKPGVNMNRSGESVRRVLESMGEASRLVVVHDDMDLVFGDVRLKHDGGDAGHRGVRSVISNLGTGKFERVRVGVRRPGNDQRALDLVLAEFSIEEKDILLETLARAVGTIIEKLPSSPEISAR